MSEVSMAVPQRLLLLRHGEVESHRGDVPITAAAVEFATEVGRRIGVSPCGRVRVLTSDTRRTRETAEAVCVGAREAGADVDGPHMAFALRNPDLYVAGQRVNMVSSPEALAAQLIGIDETAAAEVPFFAGFLEAPDRIGWWLRHSGPPGDDAATVARRIGAFAASLADLPEAELTVAVTHSPILRAVALAELGKDTGEPEWLAGLEFKIDPDRSVRTTLLSEAP